MENKKKHEREIKEVGYEKEVTLTYIFLANFLRLESLTLGSRREQRAALCNT